jgi:hypothetical protein
MKPGIIFPASWFSPSTKNGFEVCSLGKENDYEERE